MAVWTTITNSRVKVSLEQNGETHSKEFEGTAKVGDSVIAFAKERGLKTFIVEDSEGNELQPTDSNKTLAEVGEVSIYPETVGAAKKIAPVVDEEEVIDDEDEETA